MQLLRKRAAAQMQGAIARAVQAAAPAAPGGDLAAATFAAAHAATEAAQAVLHRVFAECQQVPALQPSCLSPRS